VCTHTTVKDAPAVPLTPISRKPPGVAPPATPGLSGLTTLAVGVVVVGALYLAQDVLIPLVLAILLSLALAPIVSFIRRFLPWRIPSVLAAVTLALGLFVGLGFVIGEQITELAGNVPQYRTEVEKKLSGLQEGLVGRASDLLREASEEFRRATAEPEPQAPNGGETTPQSGSEQAMLVRVQEPAPSPLTIAQNVLGPLIKPITTAGIVLVVIVFILLQREDLRDRLIRLFGASDLHRTTVAMNDATRRLGTFFLTQIGLNAAFGVIVGVGLWIIGVPNPALWGVFGTLMRFVPYIGGFIAAAPPLLLGAAVDPGWSMVIWAAGLFVVSEALMAQVVEPMMYGHSTGMSPLAIVVSTLFWGFLWGPIGLLLATPFTVCLVVLGRHVERLEFLDVLFGDRPALTPVENFYQRMLAGDPDEAQDQAEQMLKNRSLSSYYDEVALKGLQLAALDFQRGVLTPTQVETIRSQTRALVEEFSERPDQEPEQSAAEKNSPDGPTLAEKALPDDEAPLRQAPEVDARPTEWRGETPVLCIAGRGQLDEAASAMLAQLLSKHGLNSRVVPYDGVARSSIAQLDVEGVAMVCVSYLDISGNPAHLRYLLRRLRKRIPGAPMLVGLWPADDAILTDATLRREVGADYYVTSLREGVDACLGALRAAATAEAAGQDSRSATSSSLENTRSGSLARSAASLA
jgi:predicted PurR-regulated permease PerM